MKTRAMRLFAAWVGVVTLGMGALIATGTESCAGRDDPDFSSSSMKS